MKKATASIVNRCAKSCALNHNYRKGKPTKNIDPNRAHKNKLNHDPKLTVKSVFNEKRFKEKKIMELAKGEIEKYNSTQTRKDRQLDEQSFLKSSWDQYETQYQKRPKGAKGLTKKSPISEMVIQIGDKDYTDDDKDNFIQIITEFKDYLIKEFPSLNFLSDCMHDDEIYIDKSTNTRKRSTPHIHMNYIPLVKSELGKNGKYSKPYFSFSECLEKDGYSNDMNSDKYFYKVIRAKLSEIMKNYGYEYYEKHEEREGGDYSTKEYQENKEIDKLKKVKKVLEYDNLVKIQKGKDLDNDNLDKEQKGKDLDNDNLVKKQKNELLDKDNLKLKKDNEEQEKENDKLVDEYDELVDEYDELVDEYNKKLDDYKILETEANKKENMINKGTSVGLFLQGISIGVVKKVKITSKHKKRIDTLEKHVADEKAKLKKTIKTLKDKNVELEDNNKELNSYIEDMKIQHKKELDAKDKTISDQAEIIKNDKIEYTKLYNQYKPFKEQEENKIFFEKYNKDQKLSNGENTNNTNVKSKSKNSEIER